jgi:hypothetical protein
MNTRFHCVNITSKDPKALADFYRVIGAPVFGMKTDGVSLLPGLLRLYLTQTIFKLHTRQ